MNIKAFEIINNLFSTELVFLSNEDPFRFLIMVVLSAQTTDKRVCEVTPLLFNEYPSIKALASADVKKVEDIIRPLGFFKVKSTNIIKAAKYIDNLGYIPESIEELIKIPGVGRKTANCYIGTVLNKGAIIVDTHFSRVAKRLGYTSENDAVKIELDIKSKLNESLWYRFSMVLNAFGRTTCHSRNPSCSTCPVKFYCINK